MQKQEKNSNKNAMILIHIFRPSPLDPLPKGEGKM